MQTATAWTPPADTELTWFRPGKGFPSAPGPLEFSLEVQAFAFGFSRAVESLYFPLYELRARLIDGALYFAAAPSAMAEGDLEGQLGRLRFSAFRFSRNIRRAWEPTVRQQVADYTARFAAFPAADASAADLAEDLRALQRVRANQWFDPTRAVFAPAALLQQGIGESSPEEAAAVVGAARAAVDEGRAALGEAIDRMAARLVAAGCLETAADVAWLELGEVRAALVHGSDYRGRVAERRAAADRAAPAAAETVGPPLADDAPRMYLVRETLAVIGGE